MNQFQTMLDHIPTALMVVFRLSGLFIFAPMFGSVVIMPQVKIFLALLLGLSAYPVLAAEHFPAVPIELNLWSLGPIVAMEMLVGLVIGYIASIPLIATQVGGLVMGQQMGLGFAQFFNPAIDDEADVIGQILFFLALAGFLMIGGHEAMMLAILHSFEYVPMGAGVADITLLEMVTGLLNSAFELALRIAAPVLALVFLESVAMGFISKTVPQLNVLSLGFPIRILLGLAMVAIGIAVINDVFMEELAMTFDVLFDWIRLQGSA